jgi:hypothetical protein
MKVTFAKLTMTILAVGMFAANAGSETKPANAFNRLKTLVGDWDVTPPDAKPFVSGFRLVSNDTALEETFQNKKDRQMVTLYTADGDRVALTHYCSIGNQPHMETPAVNSGANEFPFAL